MKEYSVCDYINISEKLFNCMHDFIFVYDIKNDYLKFSDDVTKKFLLNSSSFHDVMKNLEKVIDPMDFNAFYQDMEDIFKGKKYRHDMTYRWIDINFKPCWVHCIANVFKDSLGNPSIMFGCLNIIGNENFADNNTGLLGEASYSDIIASNDNNPNGGFIMKIGIDDFKQINERYGADYGNHILFKFGQILLSNLKDDEYAFKLSSDEFAIVDLANRTKTDAISIYNQIRDLVLKEIRDRNYEALYTISAGIIVPVKDHKRSLEDISRHLEFSLDMAKKRGKNQFYLFNNDDYISFVEKYHLIVELNESVNNNFKGFELYFQPIMMDGNQKCIAAESLLRFHSKKGIVSPQIFIPLLEESGLIIPIGKFIFSNAISFCKEVRKYIPNFRVSINCSYIQILKGYRFLDFLDDSIWNDLPYNALIVELTESGYLEENSLVKTAWEEMKKHGINVAIDDFGTGYSNIHCINLLHPHIIKIDNVFTRRACDNDYDYKLLEDIIKMSHHLNTLVVIEGVESIEDFNKLKLLNPDFYQGYLYSKPVPKDLFFDKFVL